MPFKILFIALPGLGDTLMFTPVIEAVRRKFPEAQLTALTMYSSSQQVLLDNPHLDKVLLWDFIGQGFGKSLAFMLQLRKECFAISILSYPSNRLAYNAVSFLAGAAVRLGHRYQHQDRSHCPWLNNRVLRETEGVHNVDENLRLLKFLDIDPAACARDPRLFIHERETQAAQEFWERHRLHEKKRVIALHAWSTTLKNMHRKCWGNGKFAGLVDALKQQEGTEVLLIEGPHDREANDRICQLAARPAVRVTGLKVKETAAVLAKCHLLVTNDSGIMHLAAAVKVPCVAIFGPTNPAHLRPFYTRHRVVRTDLPCSPCFYYSTKPLACRARLNYQCLESISVAQVKEAADELLGEQAE